jgi:hypothetical protein
MLDAEVEMREFDYSDVDIKDVLYILYEKTPYLDPISFDHFEHNHLTLDDAMAILRSKHYIITRDIIVRDGELFFRPSFSVMTSLRLDLNYPHKIMMPGNCDCIIDTLVDAFVRGSLSGKFILGPLTYDGWEVFFEHEIDTMVMSVKGLIR